MLYVKHRVAFKQRLFDEVDEIESQMREAIASERTEGAHDDLELTKYLAKTSLKIDVLSDDAEFEFMEPKKV